MYQAVRKNFEEKVSYIARTVTCSSAVPAPFLDTELAVAHFVGMNSADHLLDRFLVAAVVVDSLVHILHKHPVAAV